MHRKIKSKNRKKLKPVDPFNVDSNKTAKDQHKNLTPKDDEQEVPKSFKELFLNPQNQVGKMLKKRKKNRDHKVIEGFERKSWETDKQFLSRVHRHTQDYVNDQLTKIKYGLVGLEPTDILKLADEEKTSKNKKRRRESESIKEPLEQGQQPGWSDYGLGSKESGKSGKRKQTSEDEKVARKQKRVRKSAERKEKLEDEIDLLYMREVIPFGDRVDEPPRLTVFPKKAKRSQQVKAGSKDLLLKKSLELPATFGLDSKKRYENDGTIKCDDLAKQKLLEQERRRVIETYRNQKKKSKTRMDD